MITTNYEHSHEYRTHRLVSTCSPCFLIVWVLASLLSTPLHANIVTLFAETTLPQVDFAVTELRGPNHR